VRIQPEEGQAAHRDDAAVRFLGSSAALGGTLAFEVLGTPDEVRVQWVADVAEAETVRGIAAAHFPKSRLSPSTCSPRTAS
jgi:hypothetical protein